MMEAEVVKYTADAKPKPETAASEDEATAKEPQPRAEGGGGRGEGFLEAPPPSKKARAPLLRSWRLLLRSCSWRASKKRLACF